MDGMTRRHFFGVNSTGVGLAALASLWGRDARSAVRGGLPGLPHFPATARRVIYLFQSGGPSQMELFDYKQRPSAHRLTGSTGMGKRSPGLWAGSGDSNIRGTKAHG